MIASKDRSGWFGASDINYIIGNYATKSFEKFWLEKIALSQGQDKTQGVLTTTHECSAELSDDGEVDYDTLPYHIYYPTAAAQTNN